MSSVKSSPATASRSAAEGNSILTESISFSPGQAKPVILKVNAGCIFFI